MSTDTDTAPRRVRNTKSIYPAPIEAGDPRIDPNGITMIPIPMHPPITKDGLHDEALKTWFIEHYPALAAYLYTGKIINPKQP